MFLAKTGRGCSHCETGTPMCHTRTGTHIVRLCMMCLMAWFPSKSAEWIEERLGLFIDHHRFNQWKASHPTASSLDVKLVRANLSERRSLPKNGPAIA